MTTETIRYEFDAVSNLPNIGDQIEQLIRLTNNLSVAIVNQTATVKNEQALQAAILKESLILTENIAKQSTLERKAALEIQTAQVKASEAQMTAYVQAAEKERLATTQALLKESLRNQDAAMSAQLALIKASENRATETVKVELKERLADLQNHYDRQQQLLANAAREAAIITKAEQERETAIVKSEADQRTAIVKSELNQQTMILKGEMLEQRHELNELNKTGRGMIGMMRDMRTVIGASFSVIEIVQFGMQIVDAKSKIDIFKNGLAQMIGSKAQMNEVYQDIINLAIKSPFEVEKLFEITLALKGMGVATRELVPTLEQLGNMAAIAGQDKLPLIAKAYTDVMNKGKLMKQEINQFAENGIPLYDLLAESMGKTRAEVIKMAEAHTISFADVKKAIKDATTEGGRYYGLMALQAETLGGQVSNLKDRFFIAKAAIGDFSENGLKFVIKGLSDLINVLFGSQAAVGRTVAIMEMLTVALITAKLAMNALSISKSVSSAATAVGNVVYGTYLLLVQRVTQAHTVMTLSQTVATNAARTLAAAMSTNWLGLTIAAIGTAVTAYLALSDSTDKVSMSVSDMELNLRKENTAIEQNVQRIGWAEMGTIKRRQAIEELIKRYPEYFAGLNAETVSNDQLRLIMNKVNVSYAARIDLAREAYALEKLGEGRKSLLEKEMEILKGLPDTIANLAEGSASKLLGIMAKDSDVRAVVNQSQGFFKKMYADSIEEQLQAVSRGLINVEGEYGKSFRRSADMEEDSRKKSVDAENTRWEQATANMKKGTAEYANEKKKHDENLDNINSVTRAKTEKHEEDHGVKLKNIRLVSAAEQKEILLTVDAATDNSLKVRMNLLDAQEKAELEVVNKIRVNKKASEEEIATLTKISVDKQIAIREEYNKKRQGLLYEEAMMMSFHVQDQIQLMQSRGLEDGAFTTGAVKNIKTLISEKKNEAKETKEAQREIDDARKETARVEKETSDIMAQSRRENMGLIFDLAGKQSGLLGDISRAAKAAWQDMDLISGKAVTDAKSRMDTAEMQLFTIKKMFNDGSQESEIKIANAESAVAGARKNVAGLTADSSAAALGMVSMVMQVVEAITQAIDKMWQDTYATIANSLGVTKDAYVNMYNSMIAVSKGAMEDEMASFKGTWEAKEIILNQYFAQQTDLYKRRDAVESQLAMMQEMATVQAEAGRDIAKYLEGVIEANKNRYLREQQMVINNAQLSLAQSEMRRDREIKHINETLEAFKLARETEIDVLKENLNRQKELNNQFFSDKTLRLQEDEAYRKTLLEQGEAREVAALEAAKARELARANERKATAEEVAQITTAFDKLIADKHKEYETAKGEKTRQVSLATQEVKAQEADKIRQLEVGTANQVTAIQNQITTQEGVAANERKRVNEEFANARLVAERVVFDAQKAMMIASLRAEIAILQSKRGLFNNGKINAAIGDINAAIGDINAINFGSGAVGSPTIMGGTVTGNIFTAQPVGAPTTPGNGSILANPNAPTIVTNPTSPIRLDTQQPINVAYDKDGNVMELTFNATGKTISVFDGNGNPFTVAYADGYVPVTGQRYAKGTEFVSGSSQRKGVDTIPAWLTTGERVLTVEQNQKLQGIDNTELVRRSVVFEDVLKLSRQGLVLPAEYYQSMGAGSGPGSSVNINELTNEMQKVRKAIENQKTLNLSVDQAGFALSETTQGHTTKYFSSRMTR